jgi:type IV secretory pathway VirD2 relaxase
LRGPSYRPLRGDGLQAAKLHLAYLERDGVERDGAPGRFYGADEGFDREAFGQPLVGEQRQFRLMVSPEDGDQLDLTWFARRFMEQVEKDVGRRLVWAAVNHHKTDNPHIHIVVRGVDADGDDLRMNGRYIAEGMRWRAQELATRELGPRSELEMERSQSKEIERAGFTTIDRMLAGHVSADGRVPAERLATAPRQERAACLARLAVLEKMHLARPEPAGAWRLADDWEPLLRQYEMAVEIQARMARHVPSSLRKGLVIQPGERFEMVEGVVRGLGLHDELVGTMYAVVELDGGGARYLPVRPEVAAQLAVGDPVRISSPTESWVKASDRIVARYAVEHGGVYDPAGHERKLSVRNGRNVPGQPLPAELVRANVRRLDRLERYGLVARLPAGQWRVRADLVSQLEARERTHPRHRIEIERLGPKREMGRDEPERGPSRGRGPGLSR